MQTPEKPRFVRKILADSVTGSADASNPGSSGDQSRSLADDPKELRASKAQYAKKCAKLSYNQRKLLADMKAKNQVSSFMMPDSPVSKKRKAKGRIDSQIWISRPLLPDVPAVPPPRKPQPWDEQHSHETLVEPKIAEQSAGTFVPAPAIEKTQQEDSDNDITDIPFPEIPNLFSSPSRVIQDLEPNVIPVMIDIELIELTPRSTTSITAPESGSSTTCEEIEVRFVRDSDIYIIEITSPHYQNKRKPKILFHPSSGIIEFLDPDVDPSPQSSTTRTAPEPGTSTTFDEVDEDMEPIELDDSGSEVEEEEDLSLRPRNVFEYTEECDDLDEDLAVKRAEDIHRIDAEADIALRHVVDREDGGLLNFDWSDDLNNFEGVREKFIGPSGPTFDVTGLTPLEILKKIWDDNIIDHIVLETNRYAHQMQVKAASNKHSRLSRWRDTTREEIWRFLTIIMLQSLVINKVDREYWYPKNEQLRIGSFEDIMPFNRFMLLKRCLHFVDNASLSQNPSSQLDKVMPILKHLNKKFSTLYLPEQNVSIDESLLLWKGRLSFAQSIARKKARVGIKSYELCESRTGYLWRMKVYSGKGDVHASPEKQQKAIDKREPENELERATSQIVYTLMRPLFGKGHTIIMDSFYNTPLLSRHLKTVHKTDTIGTLRLNREFVPESLKHINKTNMRTGEVVFSTTKDLSVVVWRDKTVVPLISTYHRPEVGGKEKHGYYKYKPSVLLDYNLAMGGVDHKDQMLNAYPIERTRNCCWYKKLFRRLLNVSIHNSLVIFNHNRSKRSRIENREFRHQLIRDMQQMYSPLSLNKKVSALSPAPTSAATALSQLHFPVKNEKRQRCKMCGENKIERKTFWRCSTCNVNLCIDVCHTEYHTKFVFKQRIR